jgi:hypothetical protein
LDAIAHVEKAPERDGGPPGDADYDLLKREGHTGTGKAESHRQAAETIAEYGGEQKNPGRVSDEGYQFAQSVPRIGVLNTGSDGSIDRTYQDMDDQEPDDRPQEFADKRV